MKKSRQPSLQDILKKRQQAMFVGRGGHVDRFRQNLRLPLLDDRRRFVFSISGQGGVGKTTLINQLLEVAKQEGAAAAISDHTDRDVPAAMSTISAQLEEQGYPMRKFTERYRVYRQRRLEIESDPDIPHGLASSIGALVARGGLALGRQIPVAGGLVDLIDQDQVATQFGEWTSFVVSKLGNKDEVALVRDPIEILTPLFVEGLWDVAEDHQIALFFDTYEITVHHLDYWLRELSQGRHGDIPGSLILTISGQYALQANSWSSHAELTESMPLDPFTEEEAREFLARKGIVDHGVSEAILRLSGCVPLLIAMLAAESPSDPSEVGDPSGTAIDRFLAWVPDQSHRTAAINLSVPRLFNRDILASVVDSNLDETFNWLTKRPFVEERAEGWVYHPVIRAQMLRFKKRESPQQWALLHRELSQLYKSRIESREPGVFQPISESKCEANFVEYVYHSLCCSPDSGAKFLLDHFLAALSRRRSHAREVAAAAVQAGRDSESEVLLAWGERLLQVLDAEQQDRLEDALGIYGLLLSESTLDRRSRAAALFHRARLHRRGGKLAAALQDANEATELAPDEAKYWTELGSTFSELGQLSEAIESLNRAIDLNPTNPIAYLERALTNARAGRVREAVDDLDKTAEAFADRSSHLFEVRAYFHAILGNRQEAFDDLRRARSANQLSQENFLGTFNVLRRRGSDLALVSLVTEEIERLGQSVELLLARAQTYRDLELYNESISDFDLALTEKPNDAHILLLRGQVNFRKHDIDAAIYDYTQVTNSENLRFRALLLLGQTFSSTGDVGQAALCLNAILEECEIESVAHVITRAAAHLHLNEDANSALAEIGSGLERFPEAVELLGLRAQVLAGMNEYQKALDDLFRATGARPDDVDLLAQLAEVLKTLGRYDEALDYYARLEPFEVFSSSLRNEHGLTLTYVGRYEEALALFSSAGLDDYVYAYNAAVAAIRIGKSDATERVRHARALLTSKLDHERHRGNALYGLAGVHAALGNVDEAFEYLERSIELVDSACVWAATDTAWIWLREDERFSRLVSRQ